MKVTWKQAWSVLALTAGVIWVLPNEALSGGAVNGNAGAKKHNMDGQVGENTVMRIAANSQFPVNRQLNMGVGRSMMIQFPMELRDIMVSDPEKVDIILQTNDRVFLIAKKPGAANAFFFDAQGNQVGTFEINIGSDLTSLDNLLKRLIPGSNIKSELAGATIVLTGTVRAPVDSQRAAELAKQYAAANAGAIGRSSSSSWSMNGSTSTWESTSTSNAAAAAAKPIINMISVEADEQVMLKVTVAEVNRTVLKQFGVNLSNSLIGSGNGRVGIIGGTNNAVGSVPGAGVAADNLLNCGVNIPTSGTEYLPIAGIAGRVMSGANCLAMTMRALESQGLLRTLAEPTLTAVSGESAKFLAGGEYPFTILTSTGNGVIPVVSFKEFGIAVAFTPMVLSEGRISLKIDTGVSELSAEASAAGVPGLRKRSATSTVELPSGGTMALAGLISENTRQSIDGMPGLKDLPVLGTLFRSREYAQNETELVIIVTPYLVRPTHRQNISLPTDGLAAPSELKANFLGELNRVYGKGKLIPDGGLKGSHGFIVD